jgi:hypothetical protein
MNRMIRRGHRISQNKARSLIMMIAKHGNHYQKLDTDAEVKEFYKFNRIDFDQLVSTVRDGGLVTLLENLAGPGFETASQGRASIRSAVVDAITNEEIAGFDGDGHLTLSPAWSRYETAERRLRDSMERNSIEDLIGAIEAGVSAVEGFIAERARAWNSVNPSAMLIDDAAKKVSFDVKLNEWIPRMSGGAKIVKGGKNYQHFAELKKFRDDFGAHIKESAHAISAQRFIRLVDLFRTGIAGMMIDLYRAFKMRVPSGMIREFHAADALKDLGT